MGNEGVDASKVGVALILLSALMIFVLVNIHWGQTYSDKFEQTIDADNATTRPITFKNMTNGSYVQIPVAAAYAFLQYNYRDISGMTCYICSEEGTVSNDVMIPCLITHMEGECIMTAEYNMYTDDYYITIEPVE